MKTKRLQKRTKVRLVHNEILKVAKPSLSSFQAVEIAHYLLTRSEWDCDAALESARNPYVLDGATHW